MRFVKIYINIHMKILKSKWGYKKNIISIYIIYKNRRHKLY